MKQRQIKNSPISIVVPTLNEAGNLNLLFERIDKSLSSAGISYEIIVVDDHSNDDTAAIAQAADSKYHVCLIYKRGRLGKAFSLLEGFRMASNDLVCMIDADLQYPPEAIPKMYDQMVQTGADIIVTKRSHPKTSLLRRFSSFIYNFLFVKLLFGIDYDTQSGLKLFKKEVLNNISIEHSPWTFDLEFIIRSLEQDYIIGEHEITFGRRYAGVPKVRMLNATLELSQASLRLRRQTASKRVKLTYNRNMHLLQRISIWSVALLAAALASIAAGTGNASAVSAPVTASNSSSITLTAADSAVATPSPTSTYSTNGNSTAPPTASNSKNTAAYYPSHRLSSSTTQRFMSLALHLLEAGLGFIILGAIILVGKALTGRQRQTLRNISQ